MSTDLASAGPGDLPGASPETVLPISRREIFWRAKYLETSDFLEHLAFLFWVVGDLRPRRAVTLGGADAVAHFALCQAVERLGLDAVCHGFGDWDTVSDIPEAILSYNKQQYEEFSRLEPIHEIEGEDTQDDRLGAAGFAPGSVDLLVVDREPTAALLESLATHWLPCLSRRGAILLRGTRSSGRDTQQRKALEALCADRPTLNLDQGHGKARGITLIAADDGFSPRLSKMADLASDPALIRTFELVFQRLGAGYAHEWAARQAGAPGLREECDRLAKELDQSRTAAEAALREAADAAEDREAEHKTALLALEKKIREEEGARRLEEIAVLTEALEIRETEHAAEIRALEARLQGEAATRREEEQAHLAETLRMREAEHEAQAQAMETVRAALEADISEKAARLAALEADIEALRQDRASEQARFREEREREAVGVSTQITRLSNIVEEHDGALEDLGRYLRDRLAAANRLEAELRQQDERLKRLNLVPDAPRFGGG